jgi:hypothetical protein
MSNLNENDEGTPVYQVQRSEALAKLGPHEGDCEVSTDYRRGKGCCSRGAKGCIRDGQRFGGT